MTFNDLKNESTNEFTDISSEEFRLYCFYNGTELRIDNPVALSVSENGHRVFDATGTSYYVQNAWCYLQWRAKDGQPHFVK